MSLKKASVIIVNYNTSGQVIACIESLKGEHLQNIVVVDNASPNDNPDSIKAAFTDVVLIKHTENVGFGDGCNIGINWVLDHTDSEYLLFLNPDTVIVPSLVNKLLVPFSSPDVGIAVPRISMMNDKSKLWYGGGYMSWFKGSARVPGYGMNANAPLALEGRDVEFASGCAFMIRRSVLADCGGFDSRYFMYEEDVELSLRVLSAGYRIRYVPEAIVYHIAQGSQGKDVQSIDMFSGENPRLPFFVYYAARNRFFTVFTHGRFLQKFLFLIGFIAWFGRGGLNWIKYRRLDAFKALYRGLKDFAASP
ncbi:MAG: hypothetical protein CTY12_02600 [Methylotenera sp.]|nr:MAG: hypothetical protein CTY12_02600 [Methylotenera sp.]